MVDKHQKILAKPTRIPLTNQMIAHLIENDAGISVPNLAKRSGLSYSLLYNIVNKRVHTISVRDYKRLFHAVPPLQCPLKVDGAYFRRMVNLWLYLNSNETKSSLYRELYRHKDVRKIDYRMFSGKIATVDTRLERILEMKFIDCGLDRSTIAQWIDEYEQQQKDNRFPYSTVRPLLHFMNIEVGIHPTALLNQFSDRYERGNLITVSHKIYERVKSFKTRAEVALKKNDKIELERIREEIYGEKKGYTLYAEIREALRFLQRYANRSPKRYLGRGTYMYEMGRCKRIPSWRADKILNDCDTFIQARMDLKINTLPKSYQPKWIGPLLSVILAYAADLLSNEDGIAFEKKILSPVHRKNTYSNYDYGFTQFDRAPSSLGMRRVAFDLMVSRNCEIFRDVGRYSHRWYVSDLYLKELSENPYFNLVSAKYERLASAITGAKHLDQCLN